MAGREGTRFPLIMHNLAHFYFRLGDKEDLYKGIVTKSSNWGSFCGAISGLSSLSLMTVVHPLVGIAAVRSLCSIAPSLALLTTAIVVVAQVPLSIRIGSDSGTKIGTKIGGVIADTKSRYLDGTESRYGFGDVQDPPCDNDLDEETHSKTKR